MVEVVKFTVFRNRLKAFCDQVTDSDDVIIVSRKQEKNVVVISLDKYNELIEQIKQRSD